MDLGLKGKRAAVQGASTGMGFCIAQALAQEGAHVAFCSHHEGRLHEAARQIPGSHPILVDLDQSGGGQEFIRRASQALGGVDILVTNTGGPPKGDFCDLTMEDWERGYRRLWRSATESILEAMPAMKKQRFGRVILLTSTAAKEPIPHLTVSTGFRAGLLGLMKAISREVASTGVTVNAVLPGYTHTKRLEELGVHLDQIRESIPARRLGEPSELAALVAFLASSQAGYITGQSIACDGGLLQGI